MKNRFTIKTRLTMWYIIILTIILAAFSGFIYWSMERYMYNEVENSLQLQGQQILNELQDRDEKKLLPKMKQEIDEEQNIETVIGFYDKNKKLIMGKNNSILPLKIKLNKTETIEDENIKYDADWAKTILTVKEDGTIKGYILLAHLLKNEKNTLKRLMLILFFGIIFILLVASSGGYFLAWRALSPIDRITTTAREISHSNLEKRIEEKETNDEIGRLINTLNQLLNRLEKAFIREKQFTADASHELRTPITVVRAQAEKALINKNSDEEYQHTLEVIEKQAEYMSHLIDQLLLLARSDIEQQLLDKEIFDLNELIRMVIDEIKGIAAPKNIKLITDFKNKKIEICADQRMIIQLLLNLLNNAIKYTPSAGQITVVSEQKNDEIEIQIIDTGIGISPEDQENIFERFYRVDKARSRKKGGTGLGLAICRWIVEAHGGNINVKSEENKGSNFVIDLPNQVD